MTELIVLYRIPNDPERFDKYYREVHGPMTSKLPGLKGYKYGPARALDGGPGEFFWYWSGTFDSRQAALDAIASPEGLAGAADRRADPVDRPPDRRQREPDRRAAVRDRHRLRAGRRPDGRSARPILDDERPPG